MTKQHKLGTKAGDKVVDATGQTLTICAHCGCWVAGDMTEHVQKFCPIARYARKVAK